MRVISGKWKGQSLVSFKAPHIRPTTDKVKEIIFNKIQFDLPGSIVLDLFSGTGNLAIEALSRGVARVVAVENHPKSLKILKANREKFSATNELIIIGTDVNRYLEISQENFDIILIDPPFVKKMADSVMRNLSQSKCFNEDTQIYIESTSQETIADSYGSLKMFDQKSFSDKFLNGFRIEN